MSESGLHRRFKRLTGLTPNQYAAHVRAERVRDELSTGTPVTHAIFRAGYGSAGRFYEGADAVLGMKPSSYRDGGARMRIDYATGPCSLGFVLAARSERGVCAILLGDDPAMLAEDLRERFPNADLERGGADFGQVLDAVVALVERPGLGIDLPLDIRGTAFQQRVWAALREIAPGQTLTYSQVAERIGSPNATRAVAGACAANSLAVAVPCHRVVRANGSVSGYRWGTQRKRALLERESAERG